MKNKGFTLIELVVVITILGILAVTAAPRFLNLSSSARIATLEGIESAIRSVNQQINVMGELDYIRQRDGQPCTPDANDPQNDPCRLTFFDENKNGQKDGDDFDMIWGFVDNTDLESVVTVDGENVSYYRGGNTERANAYYSYDLNQNGDMLDDNCYFIYTQAEGADIPPEYDIVSSGC